MPKQITRKKNIVTSIHNLPADILELLKEKYPLGYTDAMMRIEKPNGDFFYAVPLSTEDAEYLIKVDVKIDNKANEDDDKPMFDDNINDDDDDDIIAESSSDEDDDDM